MTLGAGVLPQWGDGKSDPALTDDELEIDAEKFDPSVRDGLVEFFQKALHREPEERFDNADEMRWAWQEGLQGGRDSGRSRRRPARKSISACPLEQADLKTPWSLWACPPVPATPWSGPTSSPSVTCSTSRSAKST